MLFSGGGPSAGANQEPRESCFRKGGGGFARRSTLWRLGILLTTVLVVLGGSVVISSSPGRAGASIGSDRGRVAALEHLVAEEGERIQELVGRENAVQLRLLSVEHTIAGTTKRLAADRRSEAAACRYLRTVAINTYVDAAAGTTNPLLGTSSATTAAEQQAYSGAASGVLDAAVANLQTAEHRTAVTVSALKSERSRLRRNLTRLEAARRSAENALTAEDTALGTVKGNLLHLVVQAEERAEAAQEAEEEEAAAAAAARKRATPPPPPPVHHDPPPTSGSSPYADPLRAIGGLTPERVDQGVDYSGYGPIYAIGDGTVLATVNGGWPGGTFIAYQLSNGPAAGLVVYAAEDINPSVSVGQAVTPNTVLGQMYEGPDGIETGWADGSAIGETMAMAYGQFSGSNSTAFGYNFSQLLESVGAPGGILETDPPTGSLPAGWPSW